MDLAPVLWPFNTWPSPLSITLSASSPPRYRDGVPRRNFAGIKSKSNMSNKLPVGILGATGIVGQRFIQMLGRHPWFEAAWLAASDRSEGRPYAEAARWRLKTTTPPHVAKMTVAAAKPEGAPNIIFAALETSLSTDLD